MAADLQRCDSVGDDYIDMEVSSMSNLMSSSVQNNQIREFEFQMSLCSLEKDSTTSPADELFYKGKLLPLHLPPRLQMVEKLLETAKDYAFDDFFSTPLATGTATTPRTDNTPFESCNVSPVESCQVSRELNPSEYFSEYFADDAGEEAAAEISKKSWSKKLKLIKQSSFGSKLKASKAYLRAFFGRSGCSDESCTHAAKVADEGSISKAEYKHRLSKYAKMESCRTPFGQIQNERGKKQSNNVSRSHRRSFSVSMRRQPAKNSFQTTLSSNNSSGFRPLQFLKRSTSANSDIENSIQGAILHCKQSLQQKHHSTKTGSEAGFCSLSAARVVAAADDQERAQLFRG